MLSQANTYSGGTTISGGVLQLGNSTALGTGSLTVNTSGTLDLHGYGPSITVLSGSGTILNATSGASNTSNSP